MQAHNKHQVHVYVDETMKVISNTPSGLHCVPAELCIYPKILLCDS